MLIRQTTSVKSKIRSAAVISYLKQHRETLGAACCRRRLRSQQRADKLTKAVAFRRGLCSQQRTDHLTRAVACRRRRWRSQQRTTSVKSKIRSAAVISYIKQHKETLGAACLRSQQRANRLTRPAACRRRRHDTFC
jgi:hypothetical protein